MRTTTTDFSFLGHELAIAKAWMEFCRDEGLINELDEAFEFFMQARDRCDELKAITDTLTTMGVDLA